MPTPPQLTARQNIRALLVESDRELDEKATGDQHVLARVRRGKHRLPRWTDVALWRLDWDEPRVRAVLNVLALRTAPEETLEQMQSITGRATITLHTGYGHKLRPDLRGLDVTVIPREERDEWKAARRFEGVDLSFAQLQGARLTGLTFPNAQLVRADFRKATLRAVDFTGAAMSKADVSDADIRDCVFADTAIAYLNYTTDGWFDRGTLILHEADLRSAKYLDPLLERYARDQAYIYVLKDRSQKKPLSRLLIRLWWLTSDYGQNLLLWGVWSALAVSFFATLYSSPPEGTSGWTQFLARHWPRLASPPDVPNGWTTPVYFSVSTFMTLGMGDIRPVNALGQAVVSLEVVLGYFMFGVLLSILSNKIARRA